MLNGKILIKRSLIIIEDVQVFTCKKENSSHVICEFLTFFYKFKL